MKAAMFTTASISNTTHTTSDTLFSAISVLMISYNEQGSVRSTFTVYIAVLPTPHNLDSIKKDAA